MFLVSIHLTKQAKPSRIIIAVGLLFKQTRQHLSNNELSDKSSEPEPSRKRQPVRLSFSFSTRIVSHPPYVAQGLASQPVRNAQALRHSPGQQGAGPTVHQIMSYRPVPDLSSVRKDRGSTRSHVPTVQATITQAWPIINPSDVSLKFFENVQQWLHISNQHTEDGVRSQRRPRAAGSRTFHYAIAKSIHSTSHYKSLGTVFFT